ncbi:MAG: hypothetical protein GEU80_03220 [Dehalococcoidia bacterium]|nr:hypothetical protein [Dehalococcoidia bacterium]
MDGPSRRHRTGGSRQDPHRPGARFHPRRGGELAGHGLGGLDAGTEKAWPTPHRGQGVRGAGRRRPEHPLQRLASRAARLVLSTIVQRAGSRRAYDPAGRDARGWSGNLGESNVRARIFEAIESALAWGDPVVVATVTHPGDPPLAEPGAKLLVPRDGEVAGDLGGGALDARVVEAAREVFEAFPRVSVQTLYFSGDAAVARPHMAGEGDARVMLQLFEAPARLVVVGGGHVGLALASVGELLGYAITVIDDREPFANRERFPMAEEVLCGDVGEAVAGLALGAGDYVVLVSRGHKQDEDALRRAVGRGAAYVGMIGSRRRTATVLQHLLSEGFAVEDLDAVATPIGLDIGAETPEEIAVAVFAEITMLRRGGTGRRMREQRAALSGESRRML